MNKYIILFIGIVLLVITNQSHIVIQKNYSQNIEKSKTKYYIENRVDKHLELFEYFSEISQMLKSYNSPLIGYEYEIYEYSGCDYNKVKIFLAIAAHESHLGGYKPASDKYNLWGYGCNYGGVRFDCGWRSWDYAIKRYFEIADNYLSLYDGTKQSIRDIANAGYYRVGMDGANKDMVDNWVNKLYEIINVYLYKIARKPTGLQPVG